MIKTKKNIINVENKLIVPLSEFFGEENLTFEEAKRIINGKQGLDEMTLFGNPSNQPLTNEDNFVLGDFISNATFSTISTQTNAVGTVTFGSPSSLGASSYTKGSGSANTGAIYYMTTGNFYYVGEGLGLYKLTKIANNNWDYQLVYTAPAGVEITQIMYIPSVNRLWLFVKSTSALSSLGYIVILDDDFNEISILGAKYYGFAYNPFNSRVVALTNGAGIRMETLESVNGALGNVNLDAITFPNSHGRTIRVVSVDTFDIGTVTTTDTISVERLQASGITWIAVGSISPTTNTYGVGYTIEYSRVIEETVNDFFLTGYFSNGVINNGFYLKIDKALFTLTDEARTLNALLYAQKLNTGVSSNTLSLGVNETGVGAFIYQVDTTLVYANSDLVPILAIPRIDYTSTQTATTSYNRGIELDYDTLNNGVNNYTDISFYSPYINLPSGIGFQSVNNLTFEELRYWLMTNPMKVTRILYQVISGDQLQVFNPLKKVSRDSNGNLCEDYIVTLEDLYQNQTGIIVKDFDESEQFSMDANNYLTLGLKEGVEARVMLWYDERIVLRKNLI